MEPPLLNKVPLKLDGLFRYLLALVILAAAVGIRFWVLPIDAGYQSLTIFPASVLCFFLCGFGPGVLATILSAIVSLYFFASPFYTFVFTNESTIAFLICNYSGRKREAEGIERIPVLKFVGFPD